MPFTHHLWTTELDERLRALYPASAWADLLAAFPGFTRSAIYQRGDALGLVRWNLRETQTGAIVRGEANERDIGWLAGVIDGEGSLQMRAERRVGHNQHYLAPAIHVANTDRGLLEKTQRLMGGRIYTVRSNLWRTYLKGILPVEQVLVAVLPDLTVKAERARILLEFIAIRKAKGIRGPYGPEEEALFERFYFGSGRMLRRPIRLTGYANPEPSSQVEIA